MKKISSNRLTSGLEVATRIPIGTQRILLWSAWLSTLLLSKLPLIIARDILGADIPWITPAWVGITALLVVTTFLWPILKPLRGYFSIMGVIVILNFLVYPFVQQMAAWQTFFANQFELVNLFGERILLAMETLLVLATVLSMGMKRKDLFLTLGDLRAPVGNPPAPPKRQKVSWPVFGTGMAILLGGLFFTLMASQSTGWNVHIINVLPWIPLILISAALNAFAEEGMYRAAPLGTLLPVIGPRHALWLTSLWFGLGHYYGGIPSGPMGLVQTGLLAMLLGRAMLDTRGMGWSWIIHMVLDTVIYFFIAATLV